MANQFLTKRVAKLTYSFATDGGAQATITPSITADIPLGAIVTNVVFEGATMTGGGGCTVAVTGGGVTLVGAQTLANNAVNGTAITHMLRAGQASTAPYLPIKATSTASLKVVIGTAEATGGGFTAFVEYWF